MDLYLDPTTHDLAFGADGQLRTVDGIAEVEQRLKVTLRAHRGEWAFNTEFGVPYRAEVFARHQSLDPVSAMLRALLASVEGVNRVISLDLELDEVSRELTVQAEVDTEFGPVSVTV